MFFIYVKKLLCCEKRKFTVLLLFCIIYFISAMISREFGLGCRMKRLTIELLIKPLVLVSVISIHTHINTYTHTCTHRAASFTPEMI